MNSAASIDVPIQFDLFRMFKNHHALNHAWFLQGHSAAGSKGQDNIKNYDDITCMCIEIQYQKYQLSNKNKKFRFIRVQPDYTIDF